MALLVLLGSGAAASVPSTELLTLKGAQVATSSAGAALLELAGLRLAAVVLASGERGCSFCAPFVARFDRPGLAAVLHASGTMGCRDCTPPALPLGPAGLVAVVVATLAPAVLALRFLVVTAWPTWSALLVTSDGGRAPKFSGASVLASVVGLPAARLTFRFGAMAAGLAVSGPWATGAGRQVPKFSRPLVLAGRRGAVDALPTFGAVRLPFPALLPTGALGTIGRGSGPFCPLLVLRAGAAAVATGPASPRTEFSGVRALA